MAWISGRCKKCGLPKDLCVCLEEAKEENRVRKGLVTGAGVGRTIKKLKGFIPKRNPIETMNESIKENRGVLKGLSGKKKCIVKGCSEDCKKCDGIQDEGCIYVIVAKNRGKQSSSSSYVPLGKIKYHDNAEEWKPDDEQVMTIAESLSLRKAKRERKERKTNINQIKIRKCYLLNRLSCCLNCLRRLNENLWFF